MKILLIAMAIFGAQTALYVALPAVGLARFRWTCWGEWAWASLLLGVGFAAVLGRMGNASAWGVPVLLLAGGAMWGLWCGWLWRRSGRVFRLPLWDAVLLVVLLLAWVVRLIHPLQTWALGQSDAYSHLGFLQDVLARGRVGNVEYPPAYAWVLAFPAWLFRIAPYWMARFGGAFFGVGLVLGIGVLMRELSGRAAAISAAALVAGFPLFGLLQKTGVGCFANQLGLLLIVAAVWAFVSNRLAALGGILLALAVSVPMMLIHVLILLAMLTLVCATDTRRLWRIWLLAGGGLGVLGLVSMWMPLARGQVVAAMLTGQENELGFSGYGWGPLMMRLARDFVAIKRVGYSSALLNGAALGQAAVFLLAVGWGIRKRQAAWKVVGGWGFLTCLHVHLGWLQFTNYQREGWSMLIALALLLGLIVGWVAPRLARPAARNGLWGLVGAGALLGLLFPPVHMPMLGAAESDVVRYLYHLDPEALVLARNMTGFASGQGDVVQTLHARAIRDLADAPPGAVVYFLRDSMAAAPRMSRMMGLLQPELTAHYQRIQAEAEERNVVLERQLRGYVIEKETISPHLEVWRAQIGEER